MVATFADNIFKCIFLNKKIWISIKISLKFYPQGSNWQYDSIGSDDGLGSNRRQAIVWTNGGLGYQHIYASLGLNELSAKALTHWGRGKWTPFRRRHFQMHFLEWKYLNSD